jgi:hypothetical protein
MIVDISKNFATAGIAIHKPRGYFERIFLRGCHKLGIIRFIDYPAALNSQASAQSPNVGASIASAASLANLITSFTTPVTGTNAMTGFRLPRGFRGLFAIVPTAAANGVTGGAIAYSADGLTEDIPFGVGWTGAANKALLFVSDGLKCYPTVLTAAG